MDISNTVHGGCVIRTHRGSGLDNWGIKQCKPNKWQCEDYEAQHTNEEWLEQASTEEKAKLLSTLCKFIYNCGKKGSIPKYMYEEDFVQWLKEKHE